MTELPEPLMPPGCDLRDYPWMPLDTRRLLKSATWIKGAAEAKVAAMTLWCEAWHQVPAGSIEDDDEMLAALSGAGARWPEVRDHALRGWVKCSDGRLYHPVVCEKAREAWEIKQAQRQRTQAAREAKRQKRSVTAPVTETVAASVAPLSQSVSQAPPVPVPRPVPDSTGRDLPPVGAAEPPSHAGVRERRTSPGEPHGSTAPTGAREAVQEEGLPILRRLTGTSDRQARALLGRLLRDAGDDCPAVFSALVEADDLRPVDPVPWLLRAVQARARRKRDVEGERRERWDLPSFVDPSLLDGHGRDFVSPEPSERERPPCPANGSVRRGLLQ